MLLTPKHSIFIAGHRGLVGSSLLRTLQSRGYERLITHNREKLDLMDQRAVREFFERERPNFVLLAAAKVGGISINMRCPADFIYENLVIETNVIGSAQATGSRHLLFLSSACVYPRLAPQPIAEDSLLTGPLEPTNAPFAVAKIAGISLCESFNRQYGTAYRTVMSTNVYGPGDDFDMGSAHVMGALIHRFHDAKLSGAPQVIIWGSGTPKREFLYVDDLADACIFLLQYDEATDCINVGSGEELTIAELARLVAEVVDYRGEIVFDRSRPDGSPRKLVDTSKIKKLGWRPKVGLIEGIGRTYEWFCTHGH